VVDLSGVDNTFSGLADGAQDAITVINDGGTDTLIGTNFATTWNTTASNSGEAAVGAATPYHLAFTDFANLTGGSQSDDFVFSDGVGVTGTITGGGGADTLDFSNYSSGLTATISTGDTGSISSGSVGFNFSAVGSLVGGQGDDAFVFDDGATLSGSIDGSGGSDTLDFSSYLTGQSVTLTGLGSVGFDGTVSTITGGFSNISNFAGSTSGTDTLTGANLSNTWTLTSANAGDINGIFTFSNVENLVGGSQDDTFAFQPGASVSGQIDGQAGHDILDFSATATARAMTLTGTGPIDGFDGTVNGFGTGFLNID
jgi:acrosin